MNSLREIVSLPINLTIYAAKARGNCIALQNWNRLFTFWDKPFTFFFFNGDIIQVSGLAESLRLCFYGIRFDTTAILYLLMPFILLSILPGTFTTSIGYQKTTRFFYFFGGILGLALNFIDLAYYRFNLSRINANFFEVLQNEHNKATLFFHFINAYFYLIVLFFLCCALWIWFYQKYGVSKIKRIRPLPYALESIALFFSRGCFNCGRHTWRF